MSAKAQRSPRPSETVNHEDQIAGVVKDDASAGWHPAAISDQVLLDLNDRLERVQRLGGAFADVMFARQMTDRLQELEKDDSRMVKRK